MIVLHPADHSADRVCSFTAPGETLVVDGRPPCCSGASYRVRGYSELGGEHAATCATCGAYAGILEGSEVRWRIDWHEGTNEYEGKTFTSDDQLCVVLARIGRERGLERGGYNKTHVTLIWNGIELWSDRLDVNDFAPGERERPWTAWAQCAAFYRSPRGEQYAGQAQVRAEGRAAYYEALGRRDYREAHRLLGEGALARTEGEA